MVQGRGPRSPPDTKSTDRQSEAPPPARKQFVGSAQGNAWRATARSAALSWRYRAYVAEWREHLHRKTCCATAGHHLECGVSHSPPHRCSAIAVCRHNAARWRMDVKRPVSLDELPVNFASVQRHYFVAALDRSKSCRVSTKRNTDNPVRLFR